MTKKSGNGASVSARDINSNEGGADKHDSVLHKLGVPAGLGTMRALEPRILLDAAALATFSDAASDQAALEASQWQREQQPDLPHTGEGFSALPTPVQVEQSPPLPLIDENSLNDDFSLTDGPTTSGSNQIVFIDSAIEDLQSIVESIGDGIKIVIIDANSDGVEQIASVLESRENIDAIHIFSHGRSGTLDLGSTKLTEASIASRHADEIETIRAALSENADILLYGCDFGANARGVSAIEALADATGADIAASEDLTGAANLGGDWDLEIEAGSVETEVIAAAAFAGVLIDSDGDFIDDLVDDDDDNDGILDVNEKVLSAGTSESFENPPNGAAGTNRDGFANAFPAGSSALSNFAGSAGYFIGPAPTQTGGGSTVTFLDAYEGTSYSGLHSGETFATEIVALALSIPVTTGTDVALSFAAYQMNFGNVAGGFFNEPGTFQIFGIATGTVQPAFPAAGSIDPDSHITVGAHPDVDLLGTTPLINNTANWQTHIISFTAAQGYDRILIVPVGTNTGTFLAIDDINFGLLSGFDTDGDGVDDHLDLDSDNDGISDLIESGQNQAAVDTNNDGRHDGGKNGSGVPFAANGGFGVTPIDTDFDGIKDFRDLDSDNDGIADAVEARPTAGYVSSTHTGNLGNNGVNDDGPYIPVDSGGSALADYRDTDSDGDGNLDSAESGLTAGFDGNGDGIGDGVGASYADPDGIVNNPFTALTNADSDASDVDYRSINVPATAPIIDLNDNNTTGDLSFLVNPYLENSGPVPVTDTDADVIDAQDDITSLAIAISGAVDGNSEQIVVNGVTFQLGTNSVNTSTNVGGVPVTMSYIGGTLTIAPTNGVTPLPQAFLDFLVRGITYEHTSEDPTAGVRTLSFTATDSSSLSTAAPAVSTINVVPINDAPVAVNDGIIPVMGGTLTNISVLGNDSDPENDPLTVQSITDPTNPGSPIPLTVGVEVTLASGTKVTLQANGTLNVTPLTPAAGAESINYTIADPSGATSTATLLLNVTAGLSPPIIDLNGSTALNLSTIAYGPITTSGGTGVGGSALWSNAVTLPGGGSADLRATITSVDAPGTTVIFDNLGDDKRVEVYTNFGADNTGGSATVLWEIVIAGVPQTVDFQFFITDIDLPESVELSKSDLANYILNDPSFISATDTPTTILLSGSVNGNQDPESKIGFAYTQTLGTEITYNVTQGGRFFDHDGDADNPIVGGTTTLLPDVNVDFDTTFTEDGGAVNVTDTDADAIDLADDIVSVTIASGGISDGADEIITLGGTAFPSGTNVVAPVQVTVGGTTFNVTFIGGTFTLTNNSGAANPMPQADLDILLRGITYENTSQDPTAGNRTLTFNATDATGQTTATAAVSTINVVPVNDAPIAVDDGTFDVPAGSSAFLQPLNNDSDPEGDPLTITGIFDPAGSGTLVPLTLGTPVTLTTGTVVTLQAGGVLEVVAPTGASGPETLDYQISDPGGATDRANISLTRIAGIGPVIDLNGQPTLNLSTISALGNPISAGGFGVGANGTWPGAVTLPGGGTADLRATVIGVDAPGTQVIFLTATDDPTVRIFTNFNTNDIGGSATIRWEVLIGGVPQVTDLQFVISDIDSVEGIELSKTDLVNYILPDPNTLTPSETSTTIRLSGSVDGAFDPGSRIGLTYGQTLGAEITYNLLEGSRVFSHDGDGDIPLAGGNLNSLASDIDFEDTFTENGSPVAIGDTDTLATDADDNDLQSATIVLTNAMTDDVLALPVLPAGMVGVIDTGTPGQITITLTGTATKAQYADAIRNITFENTGEDPDTTDRNISVIVNDGSFNSFPAISTIHIIPVNDPPVAVDDNETTDENTAITKTAATGLINPNDTDPDAADTLTVTQVNGAPANVGSQITLASGALLTVQADGSYVYDPNGQFATLATGQTATETFTYQISDGNGGFDTATVTITIDGVSGAIVLTNDGDASSGAPAGDYETTYIENSLAVSLVDSDSSLLDTEDDIVELVVTLTDGQIGDTISFPTILPGGISAAVVPVATLTAPGTITITFTGNASTTLADWDSVMQSMTFLPSTNDVHNPDPADRHVTFVATDATNVTSNTTNTTIHVIPQNDPPTLDLDDDNSGGINAGNYQGTFTEDSGGTPIHSNIVMTDLDDTNFQTATVTLTNPQADDEFIINGTAVVSGDTGTVNGIGYVVSTGGGGEIIINWTGDALITDYDAALQSISFNNTSQDPDPTQRMIDVVINDGQDPSPTRTAFINVVPVNDPPVPIDPLNPGTPPANPNAVIPNQAEVDSSAITTLDTSIYFNDPDDTVLTYSLGAGAPAWLSINATTGEIDGTPPADASQNSNVGFAGQYDVLVIAADPAGLTGQTTATFLITNPAPTATDDGFAHTENANAGIVTGNVVTANNGSGIDNDPDGDTLIVSMVDGAAGNIGTATAGSNGGLFTITSTGALTFDGNGEFEDLSVGQTRLTTITYEISDGEGGTDTATVTVTVTGTNDDPTVVLGSEIPDQTGVDAGSFGPLDITATFNDPDGNDILTYTSADLPAGLSISAAGIITGTILSSESQGGNTANPGEFLVTITADDGQGGTVTDTFLFTVTNPAPDAIDDALSTDEDTVLNGANVMNNNGSGPDVDPDGDAPLTITQVNGAPANVGVATAGSNGGEFTIDANGDLSFDPNGEFEYLAVGETATSTITYQLSDGQGGFDTATVTITINGVNDAPVPVDPLNPGNPPADPNAYIPPQSGVDNTLVTPLDVTQYVNDPDVTDTLTFTIAPGELPPGLTFDGTQISGTLGVTASTGGDDPVGNPGVYLIPMTVTDGNGGTFMTTITYTIGNPPPVAVDDAYSTDEDTLLTLSALTGVITPNDTDPDGDALSIAQVNGVAVDVGTQITLASGALLTLNTDGSFDYDPNGQFESLDIGDITTDTFNYTLTDSDGATDDATVTITINGVNDAPIVVDPLNPGTPPGDPNNVLTDQIGVDGGVLTGLDVTSIFTDPEGDTLTYTLAPGAPAWLVIDNVTGIITGTPPANASISGPTNDGVYVLTVIATDDNAASVSTTVDYTITNLPPVAVDDASSDDEDVTQTGNVITDGTTGDADTPPDSDPLTVTAVSGGTVGTPQTLTNGDLTLNADGSWTFVPNATANALAVGDTATEVVTYTIDDGNGGTDTATLTIELIGTNDTPIVVDPLNPGTPPGDPNNVITDVTTTDGATPATINVDDYLDDPDGDPLIFTQTGLPTGLSIDMVTGEITGTIDPDASQGGPNSDGVYQVTVTGTDPSGASVDTTITYTITNLPPVAVDDASSDDEDVTQTGNVITDGTTGDADTPPDSDPLTVTAVSGGTVGTPQTLTHGDLTLNADGSWTFVPNATANALAVGDTATEVVTYTIDDGNGGTDTATLTIELIGTNDTPIVVDPLNPGTPPGDPNNVITDVTTTDGATPATINVDDYLDDPDGDPLIFTQTGLPIGLSIDPNTGEITGTIDPDASQGGPNSDGVYQVTVTGTDPSGASVDTTITYTITNLPPVAVDDASSDDEDVTQTGNVITDGTTGDADTPPDSDPLTVTLADQGGNAITLGTPFTLAGGGELILNADGSWDFDPGTSYNGLDDGETEVEIITYTIDDGNGGTDQATLTITVEGSNDAPVIIDPVNPGPDPENPIPADPATIIPVQQVDDGTDYSTTPLIDVSIYAADPDDEPLTFTTTDTLPLGLTLNPDGTVVGVIDPNASQGGDDPMGNPGVYTITVIVDDGTDTSTVTLVIDVNNPPPIAVDDAVTHPEDGISTGDVFADNGSGIDADTPPDTDPITVTAVAATTGAIPAGGNLSSVGVPIASPTGGQFTINADGTYSFDPGTDFQDLDVGESRDTTISYQISDGQGGFDTAIVTVSVTGANDAPVITDPNNPSGIPNDPSTPADPNNVIPDVTGNDSQPIPPLDVSVYFVDVDIEPLTFTLDPAGPSLPTWLSIDPLTGIISGTPPSDASQGGPANNGVYPIVVVATDPDGQSVTTTIDFTILNVDPIVVIDLPDLSDTAGYTVTHPSFNNFSDPDGDVLNFSATGLPPGLSVDPLTGEISGTIAGSAVSDAPNGDGIYTVTITVDDLQGGTVSATFIYNVAPLPFVDPTEPSVPLPPFEIDGPFNPNIAVTSILTSVVNGINSLGPDTSLDGRHPVTEAVNQISPLGATTRLGDSAHPISDLIDWLDQTRDLLNAASSSEYVYLGGDATGVVGENQIQIRSIVINQMVLLEIFGEGFSPKDWNIGIGQSNSIPGWVQNVDGRAIIILRPADLETTVLKLDGLYGEMSVKIDLVTGQLKILRSTVHLTQAPLFSEQIAAIYDSELQQVKALFNTG